MMETYFIPGPWTVVVANDGDTYVTGGEPLEDGLNPICCVDTDPEMVDATAALIAAAPELFDTLWEVLDSTPTPFRTRRQVAAFERANALLARIADPNYGPDEE